MKQGNYQGPLVGEDIPPPPLWKLLLTAVLVLVPTLWIGVMLFGNSPRNDAIHTVTGAADSILRYTQEHGKWPNNLEEAVPEKFLYYDGVALVYEPTTAQLSLQLRTPVKLPSLSHRLTFGLVGTEREWGSVEVDLPERLRRMKKEVPPLPTVENRGVSAANPEPNPIENTD